MKINLLAAGLLAGTMSSAAFAAPVDLTNWEEDGWHGSASAGTWNVQTGNDSVLQTSNGQPTVFFEKGTTAQGKALKGTIKVGSTTDDDYVGFVLGYDDGEMNSANADFWLIDWKRNDQTFGGATGFAGLSLSHVTGNTAAAAASPDMWGHQGVVDEIIRANTLGSTGWAIGQEYTFELTFTASLIEVYVDGVLQLSQAGSFSDGAFGFYNFSQNNVEYAGITEDVLPPAVPLPAGFPLLLGALGGLGLLARRRRARG